MAHYAYTTNGTVTAVIVGPDEGTEPEGVQSWEDYFSAKGKGLALQTSYNTRGGVHYTDGEPSDDQTKAFRFNYAGIGFTFDSSKGTDGAFIPPTPYPSWVLDEGTCLWVAPIPMPEEVDADGEPIPYRWDEEAGDWVAADE